LVRRPAGSLLGRRDPLGSFLDTTAVVLIIIEREFTILGLCAAVPSGGSHLDLDVREMEGSRIAQRGLARGVMELAGQMAVPTCASRRPDGDLDTHEVLVRTAIARAPRWTGEWSCLPIWAARSWCADDSRR
jgi:hypothetical protein